MSLLRRNRVVMSLPLLQHNHSSYLFPKFFTKVSRGDDIGEYNKKFRHFLREGELRKAVELNTEMVGRGIKPTTGTYGVHIKELLRRKKIADVYNVLDCMRKEEVPIEKETCVLILSSFTKEGKYEDALEALNIIGKGNVEKSIDGFNFIFGAILENRHYTYVPLVLKHAEEVGISANSETYEMMFKYFIDKGQTEQAMSLLPALEHRGLGPYETLLEIESNLQPSIIQSLLKKMFAVPLYPTYKMYELISRHKIPL